MAKRRATVMGKDQSGSMAHRENIQKEKNMASMRNSPWAKLRMSITPQINVNPTAIRAKIRPMIKPLIRICTRISVSIVRVLHKLRGLKPIFRPKSSHHSSRKNFSKEPLGYLLSQGLKGHTKSTAAMEPGQTTRYCPFCTWEM